MRIPIARGSLSPCGQKAKRLADTGRGSGPADESVVFIIGLDSHPDEVGPVFDGQGPMGQSAPGRPEAANRLEMQRRLPRVILQQAETLVGKFLNVPRQVRISTRPEVSCH